MFVHSSRRILRKIRKMSVHNSPKFWEKMGKIIHDWTKFVQNSEKKQKNTKSLFFKILRKTVGKCPWLTIVRWEFWEKSENCQLTILQNSEKKCEKSYMVERSSDRTLRKNRKIPYHSSSEFWEKIRKTLHTWVLFAQNSEKNLKNHSVVFPQNSQKKHKKSSVVGSFFRILRKNRKNHP